MSEQETLFSNASDDIQAVLLSHLPPSLRLVLIVYMLMKDQSVATLAGYCGLGVQEYEESVEILSKSGYIEYTRKNGSIEMTVDIYKLTGGIRKKTTRARKASTKEKEEKKAVLWKNDGSPAPILALAVWDYYYREVFGCEYKRFSFGAEIRRASEIFKRFSCPVDELCYRIREHLLDVKEMRDEGKTDWLSKHGDQFLPSMPNFMRGSAELTEREATEIIDAMLGRGWLERMPTDGIDSKGVQWIRRKRS